ncbi:MAG: RNA polymerase sigma factor [Mongoliitalea sp.]
MKPKQLEHVIKEQHADAYRWARQCCHFQDALAQDVLQQVYLKILEGKAVFNGHSSVKTWLFSIIRYTAMEHIRKDMPMHLLEEVMEVAVEEMEESPLNHEQLMLKLPPQQREVLTLVFYHGLTLEKAAEVMCLHIGTVRTHYDRAKKSLKTWILEKKADE